MRFSFQAPKSYPLRAVTFQFYANFAPSNLLTPISTVGGPQTSVITVVSSSEWHGTVPAHTVSSMVVEVVEEVNNASHH
jgi:hypothetical protein